MRERDIERKLTTAVKAVGGLCWKFISPGTAGVPDRMVLLSGGRIAFVETKAPGGIPRKIQLKRHKQLRDLGFKVYVLDNIDDIPKLIQEINVEYHGEHYFSSDEA